MEKELASGNNELSEKHYSYRVSAHIRHDPSRPRKFMTCLNSARYTILALVPNPNLPVQLLYILTLQICIVTTIPSRLVEFHSFDVLVTGCTVLVKAMQPPTS